MADKKSNGNGNPGAKNQTCLRTDGRGWFRPSEDSPATNLLQIWLAHIASQQLVAGDPPEGGEERTTYPRRRKAGDSGDCRPSYR